MITRKEGIKVGDRIRITEDIDMGHVIYHKGHEFTVIADDGIRGLDIKDDDGNCVYECRFIQGSFERL